MNPSIVFGDMPQFTVVRRTVEHSALNQVHNYSLANAAKQVMTEDTGKPKKSIIRLAMDEDTKRKIGQDKRKEDLQDWLDNLQHRLDEACIGPQSPSSEVPSPEGQKPKQGRRGATTTFQLPDGAGEKEEADNGESNATKKAMGGKGRWKSVANLSDAALEFVTETDYVERLKGKKAAKESISSVFETILEKKVKEVRAKGPKNKAKKNSADGESDTITQKGKSGKDSKGRWKSVTNLSDTTVDYLINSDYLDKLQGRMQKDSVFSMYERLANRKMQDEALPPPPVASVRPKGGDVPKAKKKSKKKEKKEASWIESKAEIVE